MRHHYIPGELPLLTGAVALVLVSTGASIYIGLHSPDAENAMPLFVQALVIAFCVVTNVTAIGLCVRLAEKVPRPRVLVLGTGSRAVRVGEALRQSRPGGNQNIVGYLRLRETLEETDCRVDDACVLAAGDSVM